MQLHRTAQLMTGVAWTRDDLHLLEWAEANAPQMEALREALEDLWACVTEIGDLQPQTVALAKANHELLSHDGEPPVPDLGRGFAAGYEQCRHDVANLLIDQGQKQLVELIRKVLKHA